MIFGNVERERKRLPGWAIVLIIILVVIVCALVAGGAVAWRMRTKEEFVEYSRSKAGQTPNATPTLVTPVDRWQEVAMY